jgi:transcriptional regulator with XRE-family HTH domain
MEDGVTEALPPKKPTDFGWLFMQKMEDNGLSQSELSRRSTVPQSTISRYIFSPARRDPALLRQIAPHIGMDPDGLVALSDGGGDVAAALHAIASVHVELTSIAQRVNRLLMEGSTLPEVDRRDFERLVGGLLGQYEEVAAQQRKQNEHRAV